MRSGERLVFQVVLNGVQVETKTHERTGGWWLKDDQLGGGLAGELKDAATPLGVLGNVPLTNTPVGEKLGEQVRDILVGQMRAVCGQRRLGPPVLAAAEHDLDLITLNRKRSSRPAS